MTITYPAVPAADREAIAAEQFHLAYRHTSPQCAVILSGREVGQVPDDECCPEPTAFLVDFYDYRSGVEQAGVFTPGEHVNGRVRAAHERAMSETPGFISSRAWTARETS
jgi:hypothetical protein